MKESLNANAATDPDLMRALSHILKLRWLIDGHEELLVCRASILWRLKSNLKPDAVFRMHVNKRETDRLVFLAAFYWWFVGINSVLWCQLGLIDLADVNEANKQKNRRRWLE